MPSTIPTQTTTERTVKKDAKTNTVDVEYGLECSIEFKKSITRAMALRAYHKAVKLGVATGPKKKNVFGASYLLTIF